MIYNSEKIIESRFGTSSKTKFTGSSKFVFTVNSELMTNSEYKKSEISHFNSASELESSDLSKSRFDPDGVQAKILYEYEPEFWERKNKQIVVKPRTYKLNKSKVKKRLYSYFRVSDSKKRMSFVTITFPFKTSDNQAYKLFNLWLTNLRSKGLIHSYLWVVERQKNGTVHFHMLTNSYVRVKEYNSLMSSSLQRIYSKNINAFNGYNPKEYNGIDLAKNRKTGRVANFATNKSKKSLSLYITKYITKNDTVFHRLTWHCSRSISVLFCYVNGSVSDNLLLNLMHDKKTLVKSFPDLCLYVPEHEFFTSDLELMFKINNILFDTFT